MVASDGQTGGKFVLGYGGLDLAIENITGGRTVWVSDINEDANTIQVTQVSGTFRTLAMSQKWRGIV